MKCKLLFFVFIIFAYGCSSNEKITDKASKKPNILFIGIDDLRPDGDKLPGVNIVVAGTNYGTVSDLSGIFRVEAEPDQALHISRVGYEKVVIKN